MSQSTAIDSNELYEQYINTFVDILFYNYSSNIYNLLNEYYFFFENILSQKIITNPDTINELKNNIPYNSKYNFTDCSICLCIMDTFNISQNIIELPCGHIFHNKCIIEWLSYHSNKCPICRCIVEKTNKN